MIDQCYLLSLEGFFEGEYGQRFRKEAFEKVDSARRERAERMRSDKAQVSCLGAGLLLQLAVQERLAAERQCTTEDGVGRRPICLQPAEGHLPGESGGIAVCSFSQVLGLLGEPLELVMEYGERGKPYLKEYPFYFNLSHSGKYVVCAVSDREVGVDIQECIPTNIKRLAGRFFSEREHEVLVACESEEERQELFFRLWTRKEAYGKLLGVGIAGVVAENLLPDADGEPEELSWLEWGWPEGYRLALCRRRGGRNRNWKGLGIT